MNCIEPGCPRPVKVVARQLCNAHYKRRQKAGDLPPLDRFTPLIDMSGDCWEWLGAREKGGYGRWGSGLAHRESWERVNGPIPSDMTIDHICRNHGCVNPDHLRLLPPSENFSDNSWRDRTECVNGHAWSVDNTRLRIRRGRQHRVCRTCDRERQAQYQSRRRAA